MASGMSITTLVVFSFFALEAVCHPFRTPLDPRHMSPRCGPVSQFYNPTAADWQSANIDTWLSAWRSNHSAEIKANTVGGFAGTYGKWALGNPGWTCSDNGATDNCDLDPCDARVLNDKGAEIRQAYYVLVGIVNLHSYFRGMGESFEVSAIGAALSKDNWATTFYKDKDVKQVTVLKEVLNLVQTVVGIGAAFAGLAGAGAAVVGGVGSALFGGAVGAAGPLVGQHQDDTFQKAADLGGILGQIVVGSLKSFTAANNILMHGENYENTGDIGGYLQSGSFVAFPGVDKVKVIDAMNAFLVGQAINQLYRAQKIFVMGGGACGDNQGIGSGPQEATLCRDGKAWYLYYWQENDVISVTAHQWGWVASPPGADQIGQGLYAGLKIQDIIGASLDAYNVAGYNYNADTARSRAQDALKGQWSNPGSQGPSWEGTFTIPVCDVGWAVGGDIKLKEYILQPYGHESRPCWCGAVCGNDVQKTKDFIHAANMDGFQSPAQACPGDVPYVQAPTVPLPAGIGT